MTVERRSIENSRVIFVHISGKDFARTFAAKVRPARLACLAIVGLGWFVVAIAVHHTFPRTPSSSVLGAPREILSVEALAFAQDEVSAGLS
jgi:hypothetical protein